MQRVFKVAKKPRVFLFFGMRDDWCASSQKVQRIAFIRRPSQSSRSPSPIGGG